MGEHSEREATGGADPAAVVRALVEPLLEARSVELVDVEHAGGVLRVTVDTDGGIGVDELAEVNRAIAHRLDEHDPVPGRYTLEVSSPGLERPLRRPAHFIRAVGAVVDVKTVPGAEGERRVKGVLSEADDDGVVVRPDAGAPRRLRYDEIDRARTVFEWGPAERPSRPKRKHKRARS